MEQNSDNSIELLAPAGDFESLKYAVAGGCGAVYLGMTDFNARSKAKNFSIDELRRAVSYCHERGVKVYLTLNTLMKDGELDKAVKIANEAYAAGVDAALVQDLMLMMRLKKELPKLPLHASTQMGVHNLEGALFAKKLGAERVVLSREVIESDVKKIADAGIETEMFVHGAMCVSFSGNCYFSSLVSGYSGNRGKCLQLCRKKYTLSSGGRKKQGYMLSCKDICMLNELGKLRKLGVMSLKIEGRLRSREYAYVTSDVYSRALRGKQKPGDLNDLKTVFNRGDYSTAYLLDDKADLIYDKQQSSIGSYAGKVSSVKPFNISGYAPHGGDGFKVLRNGREVGNAEFTDGRFIVNGKITAGDSVHLTKSGRLAAAAAEKVKSTTAAVNADCGKAADGGGIAQLATKPYELPERCVILQADEQTDRQLLPLFDLIIYSPLDYGLQAAIEFCKNIGVPVLLNMPVIARGDDIKILSRIVDADIFDGYVANNIYALELCGGKRALLGSGLNILSATPMSKITPAESAVCDDGDAVAAYGKSRLMYLSHCPRRQLGQSCGSCGGDFALTDEAGNKFPLRRVKMHYCYFELMNAKTTNLFSRLSADKHKKLIIDAAGLDTSEIAAARNKLYDLPFDTQNHTAGRFGKGVK